MISAAGGKPSSRHPIPQDTQAHGAVRERESLPREEYRRRRRLFFSLLDGKARRPYNRDTILSGPPPQGSLGARGKPSGGRGAPEHRAHGREEAPARGGPKRRRSRPRKRKEGRPSFSFVFLLTGIGKRAIIFSAGRPIAFPNPRAAPSAVDAVPALCPRNTVRRPHKAPRPHPRGRGPKKQKQCAARHAKCEKAPERGPFPFRP